MKTDVAIIGGGPAGLMLAIELGCRGVPCVLLEEDAAGPVLPKANATSARTMEHYRRRGFADQVRALGLPPGHPQDVVYCTRVAGRELTRFQELFNYSQIGFSGKWGYIETKEGQRDYTDLDIQTDSNEDRLGRCVKFTWQGHTEP